MSLDYRELFKQMAATEQVKQATKQKAEQLKKFIELRWPDVNDLSDKDRAFLKESGDVVQVSESTQNQPNRPVYVVTVRHPGAVGKQAADKFLTKAVKDVE